MAKFCVVEAGPQDCGMMARRIRTDQKAAFISLGVNPHRELRSKFEQSSFRRSWLVDGSLAAIGGVTGSTLSSIGFIWMASSEDSMKYPIEIVKEMKRQLSQIMSVKTELVTTIFVNDAKSVKLAHVLGFKKMDAGMIAPEGFVFANIVREDLQ